MSLRRLAGLPRGAWGMTLAHIGLGVFVLGAGVENAAKIEAAAIMQTGQQLKVGAYTLTMQGVDVLEGPNYTAERAKLSVAGPGVRDMTITPERRTYPASRQTTSQVALERRGVSDLYVVLGEARNGAWTVRAFWNPWARLIFLGPFLMALGGVISLSDRRLRLGVAMRRTAPMAAEPAE